MSTEANAYLLRVVVDLAGGYDTLAMLKDRDVYEKSLERIARKHGIHHTTVLRRCERMRLILRKYGLYNPLVFGAE